MSVFVVDQVTPLILHASVRTPGHVHVIALRDA